MHSTKSAQALKRLFAGYHETSLTAAQSTKLLNGLKTSFRKHLDNEHDTSPGFTETSPKSASNASKHRGPPPSTAQHLREILFNPVFHYGSDLTSSPMSPKLSKTQRDPMHDFDRAVAQGLMTARIATGCMEAKRKLMIEASQDMANAGVAERVLRWAGSRPISKKGCATTLPLMFVHSLVPFLIAEGKEHVLWDWISQQTARTAGDVEPEPWRIDLAGRLLKTLVDAKTQPPYPNLNAAINTILEAESRFKTQSFLPLLLIHAWRSVTWLSTVETDFIPGPSEDLYDAHIAVAQAISPPSAGGGFPFEDRPRKRNHYWEISVETAHLDLRHPTRPSADLALFVLQSKSRLRYLFGTFAHRPPSAAAVWVTALGRDTMDYLNKSGRAREASRLHGLLRSELPEEVASVIRPA